MSFWSCIAVPCHTGADVKCFRQIWLSGGRGAGREAGRTVLSGLWGFGQLRLWRKEGSEGKDKSLRLFRDPLYFL